MILNSDNRFDNPEMPEWLIYNFLNAFKCRNKEFINSYQKLWEGILNGN